MSDISQLAHVLRQYEVFRKGPAKKGGGDFHKGLIHLRNVDQDRVAEGYYSAIGIAAKP